MIKGKMHFSYMYDYDIKYKPGKDLVCSNILSRAPVGKVHDIIDKEIINITTSTLNKYQLEI